MEANNTLRGRGEGSPVKSLRLAVAGIAVLVFGSSVGCVTTGYSASTTPLVSKKVVKSYGRTEGTTYDFTPLYFDKGGSDIKGAIRKALDKKGGNALLHVNWIEKEYELVALNIKVMTVQGDAVELKSKYPPVKAPKKDANKGKKEGAAGGNP